MSKEKSINNYVACDKCKWLYDLDATLSIPIIRVGCMKGRWYYLHTHEDTTEIDWEHLCSGFDSVV